MALNCRPLSSHEASKSFRLSALPPQADLFRHTNKFPFSHKGNKNLSKCANFGQKNTSRVQPRALPNHASLSQCLGRGVASTPAASALGLVRGNLKNYKQLEQLVAFGHGYNYNPNWHPSLACGRTKAAEAFKKRRNEIHGRSNLAGVVAGRCRGPFENSLNNFLFRESFLATAAPAVRQGVPGLCFTR